jgi:hypothetical protein
VRLTGKKDRINATVEYQTFVDKQANIKQGATYEQVLLFLKKIRNDSSFSSLRKIRCSRETLYAKGKQIFMGLNSVMW